jgi:hypothetical protein
MCPKQEQEQEQEQQNPKQTCKLGGNDATAAAKPEFSAPVENLPPIFLFKNICFEDGAYRVFSFQKRHTHTHMR